MTTKSFEFEKALKELEEITQWFEQTDLDLDQGLAKFERGMELATALKAHLASVENRVETIRQRFTAGASENGQTPEHDDTATDQAGLF